jgi:MinD-like ATPase involved in chromosome partitioning or flagellar assembly
MSKIIVVHSFNRAAGRSSLVANLAALLALEGYRVAAVDSDFQAPSLHLFYGLHEGEAGGTLNAYLWGKQAVAPAVCDVSARHGVPAPGRLFVAVSSPRVSDIMKMLTTPYNLDAFAGLFACLEEEYRLDYLVVDTPAGLTQETLLALALAHTLIVVLRPQARDFQASAVTVDVARNLSNPRILLALNPAPAALDVDQARLELEKVYGCPVGAVLPHSDGLMTQASGGLVTLEAPDDPYSLALNGLVNQLLVS